MMLFPTSTAQNCFFLGGLISSRRRAFSAAKSGSVYKYSRSGCKRKDISQSVETPEACAEPRRQSGVGGSLVLREVISESKGGIAASCHWARSKEGPAGS